MDTMNQYKPGDTISHKTFGEGRIIRIMQEDEGTKWEVEFSDGIKKLAPSPEHLAGFYNSGGLTYDDVKRAVRDVLAEETTYGEAELGEKWYGGKIILIPGKEGSQPKEIPMNVFFHKIVMLRDRLRVLEQRINSHQLLDDVEKVNMQQYITKIYGTLTTFNVLFRDKKDHFVGEKE